MKLDFTGRNALVIGGTTGIGREVVLALAQAGARVVFAGLEPEAGEQLEREVAAAGGTAHFRPVDVRSDAQVRTLVEEAAALLGRIDVAVNNAGIEGVFAPTHLVSEEDFDRIIAVNLKGIWLGLKYQIRHMLAQGGGVIVNTASTASTRAIPNVPIYSASKHAVLGLTRAAALEVAAANIRINAVAPGPTHTGLLDRMIEGKIDIGVIAASVPMGRVAAPAEAAAAVLWLCSDAASFVTGTALYVDGGVTAA
ncbi:MAG: glucose 1-dehydrogenase [Sphingomonas sp.]